jgi:phosphoglycolate phosphatase-like HAD superfamily hydrolase
MAGARTRLLLFDVDGTLIDTAGAGRLAMVAAFEQTFGLDRVETRSAAVRFAGMTDPSILEAVAAAVGVTETTFRERRDELVETFLGALEAVMQRAEPRRRVLPGVVELLTHLSERDDVRLGLVTGNLERGARIKLDAFGLVPYFAGGGFSSDHPSRREIARIAWRRLCDRTGIAFAPDDVVVVGDTEHDVDCARANGFRAVAVDSGWVARADLERAGPDHILDGLAESRLVLGACGLALD